jgi:energy-coupling factor transporter ATP-binding protein EcfA2
VIFIIDRDCFTSEVRAKAEETVDDLNLKYETGCVICVVRHNSEGKGDYLNIKYEAELLSAK